ncbi:hypothetical protein [Flavobacterium urumqiense]|uniref:Glycosyltransferase, GT2 family n=1 Tax=Flavobacterium urumqiense TaxID=935224 RepID=A0A1H5Y0T9_9FLAO|nr:hypothetical protein [Flavobacterium urumqiense]SEG17553.1 Glycosyltransferase, GT2 family [Flavobacterium urumqiense]
MTNYNLILITTHQDELNIFKLIHSIDSNIKKIKVLMVVVSQECEISYSTKNSFLSIAFIHESKMGLSKARNIALKYLLSNVISAEYIMFPDDDSSFDENFFMYFPLVLNTDKCYITPIYNEGTKELYLGKFLNEGSFINEDKHSLIGSPNQVVLYEKFKEQVFFDEDLGVGGKFGSCEDYDHFIRLSRAGAKFYYISKIYSFHPAKSTKNLLSLKETKKRYKSYSPGFVCIIKKYKKYKFIPLFLLRPLGGSLIKIFGFDFKMANVYFSVFFFRIELLIKKLV